MHVKRLQVASYCGLKNLDISFLKPEDDENSVNIIIGKNGCGKTAVLELISNWFTLEECSFESGSIDVEKGPDIPVFAEIAAGNKKRSHTILLQSEIESRAKGDTPPYKTPQFIYLPAMLQLGASNTSKTLSLEYKLSTKVQDNILSRTADYIKDYVIAQERQQNEANADKRAELAVDAFNKPFASLNLSTKLAGLDDGNLNAPLFSNIDGETFDINGLSDGEKQIYGRLVGLMMLQPKNSVILIDEPEIAIHPAWQYRILDVYQKIGTSNQFIVATHSPQILSSAPWQLIQVLSRTENRTNVEKMKGPPTGIDSASVLAEVMGAEFYHPELIELKRQYRSLFDAGKESTSEGLELKERLEDLESHDSEFFQELRMIKKIRERNDENHQ